MASPWAAIFDAGGRAYEVEVLDAKGRAIAQQALTEQDVEVIDTEVAGPA